MCIFETIIEPMTMLGRGSAPPIAEGKWTTARHPGPLALLDRAQSPAR